MSDIKNNAVNDDALSAVAGGITSLNMSESSVGGDQTVLDKSSTFIRGSDVTHGSKSVDIGNKTDIGDKVGGSKSHTDVNAYVDGRRSIF